MNWNFHSVGFELGNIYLHNHWRRSALNSAGALQGGGGEFRGIYTLFYTIKFRGGPKCGGARAPAAPASSAPMIMQMLGYDKNL